WFVSNSLASTFPIRRGRWEKIEPAFIQRVPFFQGGRSGAFPPQEGDSQSIYKKSAELSTDWHNPARANHRAVGNLGASCLVFPKWEPHCFSNSSRPSFATFVSSGVGRRDRARK